MVIKKIIGRLKLMNSRFKKNPIAKDNRFRAMKNYIVFNVLCRLKNKIHYKGINGLNYIISKGDAGLVGNVYYGLYEVNESMFTIHFLCKNDTFLDVGANLGHYSLIASGVSGANSICIEPIPKTFQKMMSQIENNHLENKITALNIGMSNEITEMYFSNDSGDMDRIVDSSYKNSIKIAVSTIDEVCKNKEISLIKIDVEGYEKFVLQGADKVLKSERLKAIIIELNNSGKNYGVEDEDVYNELLKYGFLPFEYFPLSRELIQLESYNKKQFNTIFIKDIDFVKKRIFESQKYKIWNKII